MSERIDKFLWSVRLFKTRSIATDFCKNNRVTINGEPVKPSREIKPGNVVGVKKTPIWHKYTVKDLPKSRVGAKLVEDYIEDITSKEDLEYLEILRLQNMDNRPKGDGRPTKKDRRQIDDFLF